MGLRWDGMVGLHLWGSSGWGRAGEGGGSVYKFGGGGFQALHWCVLSWEFCVDDLLCLCRVVSFFLCGGLGRGGFRE